MFIDNNSYLIGDMNTRNTIQRTLVLETVREMHNHPDAEQVYEKVAAAHPTISKATVYRNLNLLAEQGAIRKICTSEGADRFDFRTDEHYHMRCRLCGKVLDAPDKCTAFSLPRAGEDFTVEQINIELVGLCSDCRNKN